MYDPFATPPPPGMVQTAGLPQQPQVVSQNNALAALYDKHMRKLAGPNTQFPLNPGAVQGQAPDGWRDDFQQARMDWRGDMPDRPTFEGPRPDDWRAQMDAFRGERRDWRDLRPQRRDYRMGTVPVSGV
jgi:hypothetical protein